MNMKIKLLITSILFIAFAITGQAKSDIEIIKERVLKEAMKPAVDDAEIAQLIETIKDDGTWPGIDYQNVSREGFEHRFHHENMVALARAYKSKSSKFYKKKKVIETINLALKNWVDHDYFCDNWWHNQIGTPHNMVTLMLLVGDQLDNDLVRKTQPIIGRATINAPGARPGGDRIKIVGIQAKNCLFNNDEKTFNELVRVIEGEIKFSEWVGNKYGYGFRSTPGGFQNREMGGRGIMYDYSFHHRVDGVDNTLSYGTSYASAFVEWASYVNGTSFAFSQERLHLLIDYYLDGICKHMVYGKYPDPATKNRSITRPGTLHAFDASIPEKLIKLSNYRKDELQEIADIRNNVKKPTSSFARYFWDTERFVFQRPGFYTSVRMYSKRVHNMEQPYNSEGLFNHHRGDGVNHISVTGDELFDIWPVYDWQKIPGTTVMQKPEMPPAREIQKLGTTSFVGAVTDGEYGAAAFDFASPHDPLIARKSWFFFDKEYVCLGAGISCRNSDLPVVTTINQCYLRGDVTMDGNQNTIVKKGQYDLENTNWIFHDNVGYVFLQSEKVVLKTGAESGAWWDINKQSDSPKEKVTHDVFKLWIDHGKRPSDATYQYMVVPATTVDKLKQNTSKNNVAVIANSPEVQAVKHSGLNMVQAVYYTSGDIQLNSKMKLISENPGIILLKLNSGKITEISVSDPNRELQKYHLAVSSKIKSEGENFISRWSETDALSYITIDLPQGNYAGSSVTIKL